MPGRMLVGAGSRRRSVQRVRARDLGTARGAAVVIEWVNWDGLDESLRAIERGERPDDRRKRQRRGRLDELLEPYVRVSIDPPTVDACINASREPGDATIAVELTGRYKPDELVDVARRLLRIAHAYDAQPAGPLLGVICELEDLSGAAHVADSKDAPKRGMLSTLRRRPA